MPVCRKGWGGAVWKVLWASRGRAGGGAGCSPFGEGDAGLGRVRLGVRGWVVCGGALKVAPLWCLVQAAVAGRASLGKSLRWVRKGSFVTGNAAQEQVTAGWRGRQGQGSRCQGPRHGVIVTVTESYCWHIKNFKGLPSAQYAVRRF